MTDLGTNPTAVLFRSGTKRPSLILATIVLAAGCFKLPGTAGLECFSDDDCHGVETCQSGDNGMLVCSSDPVEPPPSCADTCERIVTDCDVEADTCAAMCSDSSACRDCLTNTCTIEECAGSCGSLPADDGGDDGGAVDPYTCEVTGTAATVCTVPDAPGTTPIGECNPIAQDCPAGQ